MLHLMKPCFQTCEDGTEDAGVVWLDLCVWADFSVMNINKAHHRSKLTDQQLSSTLRIVTTKLTQDIDVLAKNGDQTTLFPLKTKFLFCVVKKIILENNLYSKP